MKPAAKMCARSTLRCNLAQDPRGQSLGGCAGLGKSGFSRRSQGKHIVMSNGQRILTIPRHNPVNAMTMGGIARDAGLTVDEFCALL